MPEPRAADGSLDFASLEQPRKPNRCLVLPPGFGRASPHIPAPE